MKTRMNKSIRNRLKRHKPTPRILRVLFDKLTNCVSHSKLGDNIGNCVMNRAHF